jgi:hypothetical protein
VNQARELAYITVGVGCRRSPSSSRRSEYGECWYHTELIGVGPWRVSRWLAEAGAVGKPEMATGYQACGHRPPLYSTTAFFYGSTCCAR